MIKPLSIRNLVKNFGGLRATDDVSFDLEEGQSMGLIGPNGAGKTTIFSQIMGEYRQTSGAIELYGSDISKLSTPARIRLGVSRTYQVPRPFSDFNVLENIRVGLMPDSIWKMITEGPNHEREIELALSVGFSEDDLHQTPDALSMGDLRKLEMARTMATNPKIMLLDEPTAGLSPKFQAEIFRTIKRINNNGVPILLVEQNAKQALETADKGYVLVDGSNKVEGAGQDLINDRNVARMFLGSKD